VIIIVTHGLIQLQALPNLAQTRYTAFQTVQLLTILSEHMLQNTHSPGEACICFAGCSNPWGCFYLHPKKQCCGCLPRASSAAILAVVQTSATGIDGVADQQKLNRAWAAPPALPAGLGTQHLKYFAGLSSTLLNLRECQPAIALLRASAHILSMESTSEPVAYHSFLANFAGLLMKQVSLQMCMLSMQLRSFAGFVNRLLLAHVTVQDVKKLKSINLLNTCHAWTNWF